MSKEKTSGERFVEEMELKLLRFSKEDLWKFTLKEICKNMGITEFDFCCSNKYYNPFKRRFDYFVKRKEEGKND